MKLESASGTYALILKSDSNNRVQIGRSKFMHLKPGYYIYIGSAFGPGGVRARVSRHLRTDKRTHWHIDYLLMHVSIIYVRVSYDSIRQEHKWAKIFLKMPEMIPINGFGCSDCNCQSHLFYTDKMPMNGVNE